MSEKKPLPTRELTFKLDGNEYKIKYPNTGGYLQIESMKISMSGGNYAAIASIDTVAAQLSRYTTDMIAFLSVTCPELKKDLKVETFSDLEMIDSKRLLNLYIEVIMPWIRDWEILLNSDDKEEVKA